MTIITRHDTEEYESFFLSHGVSTIYSVPCSGTAHEKTLDMLGIEKTEKAMLFSAVPGDLLKELIRKLTVEMKIDLPDRGVAVAIPLSGIGGARTLEYFTSGQMLSDEQQTEGDNMQLSHELIVAIYEKGYTDMVMDAAREAGARGGTVVHAKGTGSKYSNKFFGISIAEEKEMIYIVAGENQKKEIMRAIMDNAGIDSDAHTIVFSLPVSDTAGLRLLDPEE